MAAFDSYLTRDEYRRARQAYFADCVEYERRVGRAPEPAREGDDYVLATVTPAKEELQAELRRLTRVTEEQEETINTLVGTVSQLRGRLEQMEEEWMGWVATHSGQPLVVTPPGLSRPEHFQLSQGLTTPVQAGAGITDPIDA